MFENISLNALFRITSEIDLPLEVSYRDKQGQVPMLLLQNRAKNVLIIYNLDLCQILSVSNDEVESKLIEYYKETKRSGNESL